MVPFLQEAEMYFVKAALWIFLHTLLFAENQHGKIFLLRGDLFQGMFLGDGLVNDVWILKALLIFWEESRSGWLCLVMA